MFYVQLCHIKSKAQILIDQHCKLKHLCSAKPVFAFLTVYITQLYTTQLHSAILLL